MYRVRILESAARELARLDKSLARRIVERTRWLAANLAPKAHEAARCAGAQGKFWEYHDLLFERVPRHAPEALEQYARELALDGPAFVRCLDGGVYRDAVAGDIEEGRRLGVTATPTFFINGRKLVGAKPLAAFQQLIESELAR